MFHRRTLLVRPGRTFVERSVSVPLGRPDFSIAVAFFSSGSTGVSEDVDDADDVDAVIAFLCIGGEVSRMVSSCSSA